MNIRRIQAKSQGIKLFICNRESQEIAHAYLYIMYNDLHSRPFGLMEDVYVDESIRGQGIGAELINEIIKLAKENNCYKIIATSRHSRPKVHKLYLKLGFLDHGAEFRINF